MRSLLTLALSIVLFPIAFNGAAELGTATIDVVPEAPTPSDEVTLLLYGTWPDSCVPQSPRVMRLGNRIHVDTSNPSEVCMPATTDWQLEAPVGELPAGTYEVTVTYTDHDDDRTTIGQDTFQVTEEPEDPPSIGLEFFIRIGENDNDEEPHPMCVNPYHPGLLLLLATVDEAPRGASIPAAMVVTTSAYNQEFSFRTSQRFDFSVFNEAGEEVWRWSDDQAFMMVLGEETYTTDGVLYFARLDTSELPEPGTYILKGTLTTEGRVDGEAAGPAHVCTTFELTEG